MSRNEVRLLLDRYCEGKLTPEDERKLSQQALLDQDLFNEMGALESIRQLLESPTQRHRIMLALENQVAPEKRAGRFVWVTAGGLAAVLAIVLIVTMADHKSPRTGPFLQQAAKSSSSSGEPDQTILDRQEAKKLFQLPLQQGLGGRLSLNRYGTRPRYELGAELTVNVRTDGDAELFVIERRPDRSIRLLFPPRYSSSSLVRAKQSLMIPAAGQGSFRVDGPSGVRKVRMILVPPGTTLNEAVLGGLNGRIGVIEQEYEVVKKIEETRSDEKEICP